MPILETLKSNKTIWDLYTGKEEYDETIIDQYQRFPYYRSKHRNPFEPEASIFLIEKGYDFQYPNGKKFAVCLTHDIDQLNYTMGETVESALRSLRHGRLGEASKAFERKTNKKKNPRCNFDEIMEMEKKYNAKSSFYIMAFEDKDLDFNYDVNELSDQLNKIINMGWEVGLHGGHQAFINLDALCNQKKKLEKVIGRVVIGYRNHYMRFKTPTTWELLKDAGFKYDTTFGYHDCVGFRNGMCHPFKPFNLTTNSKIDIIEIPLVIMDCTLWDYMKLNMESSWAITKQLIDTVQKYSGVITILWHNTNMMAKNHDLYEKILHYCYDKNAWMTSGEEIADHFREFAF